MADLHQFPADPVARLRTAVLELRAAARLLPAGPWKVGQTGSSMKVTSSAPCGNGRPLSVLSMNHTSHARPTVTWLAKLGPEFAGHLADWLEAIANGYEERSTEDREHALRIADDLIREDS